MKLPFYYIYGDDVDMIEKKWFPDLQQKYVSAQWLRYDASIDEIPVGKLVTEYLANDLFASGKVIVIRNADAKQEVVESLSSTLLANPIKENALILVASGLNGTTRLGKLVKSKFIVKEFVKPEVKPFDLLDNLNSKSIGRVLSQYNKLQAAEFSNLALYSILCGHFSLLKQIKSLQHKSPDQIARELGEHQFRVKKAMVALRYWSEEDLKRALTELVELGNLLRSWQYDDTMLLQMYLIKLCL